MIALWIDRPCFLRAAGICSAVLLQFFTGKIQCAEKILGNEARKGLGRNTQSCCHLWDLIDERVYGLYFFDQMLLETVINLLLLFGRTWALAQYGLEQFKVGQIIGLQFWIFDCIQYSRWHRKRILVAIAWSTK